MDRLDNLLTSGPWPLAPGPWSLVPGPWSLVPGPWSLVPGPWSLVPGPWPLAPGPWPLAPGPWSLVPGPWSLVPRVSTGNFASGLVRNLPWRIFTDSRCIISANSNCATSRWSAMEYGPRQSTPSFSDFGGQQTRRRRRSRQRCRIHPVSAYRSCIQRRIVGTDRNARGHHRLRPDPAAHPESHPGTQDICADHRPAVLRVSGVANDQRPETRDQRPETRDQRPGTRDQRPETRGQRPETRDQRPDIFRDMGKIALRGWQQHGLSALSGPWPLAPGPWPLAPGPWSLAPGPRPLVPGPWRLVPGPWPPAPGPWPPAPGPWSLAPGAWSLAPGPRPLVPGPWPLVPSRSYSIFFKN